MISACSSRRRSLAAAVAPPATPPIITTFINNPFFLDSRSSKITRRGRSSSPFPSLYFSIASSACFGLTPTEVETGTPPLNSITVGMLITPKRVASSGSSSILTLPTYTSPLCSSASSSTTGESMRHGPHQGAQKSTSTGFSAARTSRSKLSCVTVKTDILKTPFASDDIASPVYIHRICQNACSFRDNITILWVWIKLVSASSPSPDEQASAHLRSQRPRARVQPRLPPENI